MGRGISSWENGQHSEPADGGKQSRRRFIDALIKGGMRGRAAYVILSLLSLSLSGDDVRLRAVGA